MLLQVAVRQDRFIGGTSLHKRRTDDSLNGGATLGTVLDRRLIDPLSPLKILPAVFAPF